MKKDKPRALSGKYIGEPIRKAGEILRFGKLQEGGCIAPPEELPFGYWKQGVWYVQVEDRKAVSGRTKRSAIQEIFKFYYPFNGMRFRVSYRIQRVCKTTGCLNYKHYDMLDGSGMSVGEKYMATEQVINLLTSVLERDEVLTFGDGASAESFRMHIYRLKRKWKKEQSPYHERFQDVVIKKGKEHPNMLDFTTHGRSFDSVLEKFREAPNGTVEEPMGVEEKEYLDGVVSGRDYGTEALEKYGYSPGGAGKEMNAATAGILPLRDGGQTAFTYEAVQAKAMAANMAGGDRLTKEEEEILALGGAD